MDKLNAFIERDISLVKFNKRVAEEAGADSPIFERLKFLSIFVSNMREFYMIRVGSLYDDLEKIQSRNENTEKIQKLLDDIFDEVKRTYSYAESVYKEIVADFRKVGFNIKKCKDISSATDKKAREYFKKEINPLLSKIIIGKNDLFLHLKTGVPTLIVEFEKTNKSLYGICEMPEDLERCYIEKGQEGLDVYLVEDLMLQFADKVFDGMKVKRASILAITRNADFDIDESMSLASDYRNMMSLILNRRNSLLPDRIEYKGDFSGELRKFVVKRIRLTGEHIFESCMPLDFAFVKALENFIHFAGVMTKTSIKGLEKKRFIPAENAEYDRESSLISYALSKDMFFNYPYNSMKSFLRFMDEIAESPEVTEIKMTLYRVCNNSKIVDSLIKAAEKGKKVKVLMELKARFDEKHNIEISKLLQEAGVEVFYGVEGYKVHSKLLVVSLKKGRGLTYVGTGNFHEITAKLYQDIGILTRDKDIFVDANNFFEEVSTGSSFEYKKLFATPNGFKKQLIEMIEGEIDKALQGKKALIVWKCNAVTHPEIIEKLIEASRLGVEIKLIVRGACSILPNVDNQTKTVELRSVVGEFLEHARIYAFGCGSNRKIIIGSCDVMKRNLDHRYELLIPVEDKDIFKKLSNMLNIYLKDNVKARVCDNLGNYSFVNRKEGEKAVSAQDYFKRLAVRENRKFLKENKV